MKHRPWVAAPEAVAVEARAAAEAVDEVAPAPEKRQDRMWTTDLMTSMK